MCDNESIEDLEKLKPLKKAKTLFLKLDTTFRETERVNWSKKLPNTSLCRENMFVEAHVSFAVV